MNKIHGINFLFMLSFSFGIPTTLLHAIIITNLEFIGIVNLLHYSLTLYIHTFVTLKQDKIFIHFLKSFLLPGVKLLFFLSSPLFMRCRRCTMYVMQTPFALFVKQAAAWRWFNGKCLRLDFLKESIASVCL